MPIPIDRLVRSRRKTIAIIVEHDAQLDGARPLRMSEARINAFVESHCAWITRNQAKVLAVGPISPKRYLEGETFLFLGNAYPLNILTRQHSSLTFDGKSFRLSKSALPKAQDTFVRWYKGQAALYLFERVLALAGKHDFHYQKIRISSARTRWGSCSSRGTLSFTYRLIMAPPEVVDYVVMHELVHTQIHNHSRKFWDRLEELMPDFKRRLAWLKKNGKYLL